MATIRKIPRSNGTVYKAVIKDKKGTYLKSKTFTRHSDAKAWVKRIEGDAEQLEALGMTGAGMLFADLIDEYMAKWNHRDPTQAFRMKHWRDVLGKFRLADITTPLLRQKLKEFHEGPCKCGLGVKRSKKLDRKRSASTVNRHKCALSGLLTYAVQQEYIRENPLRKVPCLKVDNARTRFLSDNERERLFEACKQSTWPKLYLLVLLALCSGMRKSELLSLRWSDIDFDEGLANLERTKNGRPRVVPIAPLLCRN